jgi:probable phosphoglycerate mutase
MQLDPDLMEWNYGEYEGLTTAQIQRNAPGWMIFEHGCPGGESPDQIGVRVDRLIGRVRAVPGRVALFAHGHVFRVFAARWIGLPPTHGRHFLLDTSTLSILGYYRGTPAVKHWNAPLGSEGPPS